MILCDTNVLVALIDKRDELFRIANQDLDRLARQRFAVTEPVLTETVHLLPEAAHRRRLNDLIALLPIIALPTTESARMVRDVFDWLDHYAEHTPDWADAHLAILCGQNKKLRIWTYDHEFRTIWRRPDGTRIPIVGKQN